MNGLLEVAACIYAGSLLEVKLWWDVADDNAQDQQAYQAAVAAASCSHTCTRHRWFGWLTSLCLPYNVSTGAVLRELGMVSLSPAEASCQALQR